MTAPALTVGLMLALGWLDAALGWGLVFQRSQAQANAVRWAGLIAGTAWFGYYCWRHF